MTITGVQIAEIYHGKDKRQEIAIKTKDEIKYFEFESIDIFDEALIYNGEKIKITINENNKIIKYKKEGVEND